ncbi:hypothetical protein BX616_010179 [Lobosporangium transversale]|uniref:RNI-like protein n=1 Tax=Lobosporangium transversale TaxID=64571 RepID=A0A1Y2H2L3_9FUNG|nr:hypothetical protein BCR41DRAFT_418927 [Lobosporangium transversale]KAF9913073.1 hypothetical protein BX616_010179 [Lobosporangium transversale]ORZ27953.1 hypothetical protein BCR41DRAFT_418927 [Lobosporangium transversale]|eukprot:XP_021885656.1 hypothetical protein BCR41DRAFT_418927 [Lobosporangium transversale]
MTQHQYQQFRKDGIIEHVCVRIVSTSASNGGPSCYVTLQDIRDVFPNAQRFKLDGLPIPFLVDSSGSRIEPLRIAFYPYKVLDVIAEEPQLSNANSGSTAGICLPTSGRSANLDRLTTLQKHTHAILIQNLELHDCTIPRLFIMLPVDHTNWDPLNILKNKLRLHFLCECGGYTANTSESSQNQIHIAKHDGYEVRNSIEFFRKYGKRMLILLQWLKVAIPSSASLAPVPHLVDAGIDYSIDYIEALSKENLTLNNINKIDDYEPLEGADPQQLLSFLRTNDEDERLGNLYKIMTETGRVKWICVDHYRLAYKEEEQKAFEGVVGENRGNYDLHLGKVMIILRSKVRAEEFFTALANVRHVYELDITFDWDWTVNELEAFESALKVSSISVLRLDIGRFQKSINGEVLSTSRQYDALVRIIKLNNMKTIHITLSPDLIKLPSLRPKQSSQLHKLSFGMSFRSIGASELLLIVNSLKKNMALTTLALNDNSIRNEGALALSEALKNNTVLTTLDLSNNSIDEYGAAALSEALKTNTMLTTLNLCGSLIGDAGAQALSEALKVNTTLTTLDLSDINNFASWIFRIEDRGTLALSEALKVNTALTTLRLRGNFIGNEGALALSEALKINKTLATLDLERTLVGEEGALALLEALKINTTLTTLEVDREKIGARRASALSEALEANAALTFY